MNVLDAERNDSYLQALLSWSYFNFNQQKKLFMGPNLRVNFLFDVTAEIPGKHIADASRAYRYYDDEDWCFVGGVKVDSSHS